MTNRQTKHRFHIVLDKIKDQDTRLIWLKKQSLRLATFDL
jgi:hypothetical protein